MSIIIILLESLNHDSYDFFFLTICKRMRTPNEITFIWYLFFSSLLNY